MQELTKWIARRQLVSEQLIIRLASDEHQIIHWLVWSDSEKEIIASGDLANAAALTLLTEKAQSRKVICLTPSVDVTLKSVAINGKLTRQIQQALPYMIEDELASDVDKLHFSILNKKTDLVDVAICYKSKIQMWLGWLADTGITCQQFIPETLALPEANEQLWQVLQLEKQWLIREGEYKAWSCDDEMLVDILQLRLADNSEQKINSYSRIPERCLGQWQAGKVMLPMQLLAEGCIGNTINLLSGEFNANKSNHLKLYKWKLTAIAAIILLALLFINTLIKTQQLDQQTVQVKKQVEMVYQKAFPGQGRLAYSRIKKKLRGLLNATEGSTPDTGLLIVLNNLVPALQSIPSLSISNLKFDSKNQQISLAISADSFQAFEQLAEKIPSRYTVEQGTLNNNKNRISGTVTVRDK